MTLRPAYLLAAALIFAVEVAIARGVIPGDFVRGSVGDVLVIALIYALIRGVTRLAPVTVCAISIATGFVTEGLQYLHAADRLGLQPGGVAAIVLGSTFTVQDLLMYVIGGLLALGCDRLAAPGGFRA